LIKNDAVTKVIFQKLNLPAMPKAGKLQAGQRKPARRVFANVWQAGQF
jgi:hypothetical protein